MALNTKFSIQMELDGSATITQQAAQIQKSLQGIGDEGKKLKVDFESVFSGKGMFKAMEQMNLMHKGLELVVQGVQHAFETNVEFEHSMSVLAGVAGKSKEELYLLAEEAKQLGVDMGVAAKDVVELETELSRLGFSDTDILNATESVMKFGFALEAGLGEAAELAGATLRAFGDDATNMERYVSVMTAGANKSALSFDSLQTSMSTIAPVAHGLGMEVEDVVALLGVLSDTGFDAGTAATSLRNILLKAADSTSDLNKALGGAPKSAEDLAEGLLRLRDQGTGIAKMMRLVEVKSTSAFKVLMDGAEKIVTLKQNVTGAEGELDKLSKTAKDDVKGVLERLDAAWKSWEQRMEGTVVGLKKTIDFFATFIAWLGKMNTLDTKIKEKTLDKDKKLTAELSETKLEPIKQEIEVLFKEGKDAEALTAKENYAKEFKAKQEEYQEALDRFEKYKAARAKRINQGGQRSASMTKEQREEWSKLESSIPIKFRNDEGLSEAIARLRAGVQGYGNLVEEINKINPPEVEVSDDALSEEEKVRKEIDRLKQYLYDNPNLTPEVKIKYLNDIASLEASTEEAKYKLAEANYENQKLVYASEGVPLEPIKAPPIKPTVPMLTQERLQEKTITRKDGTTITLPKRKLGGEELKGNATVGERASKDLKAASEDKEAKGVDNIVNKQAEIEAKRTELAQTGSAERRAVLSAEIADMEKELAGMTAQPVTFNEMFGELGGAISGIDGMINSFEALGKAIDEDASDCEKFMAGFNVIQSIVSGIEGITKAMDLMDKAIEIGLLVKKKDTAANVAEATTGAASSVSSIPIVGPILAIAAVAGIIALLAKFMFEKGGIVGYADGGMPGIIGGASYTGDKIPIRVNSGEMILNKGQQASLYKAMHPAVSGSGISVWQQKQLFGEIKGLRGFAIGGIAGMGGFSMPTVSMPTTVGEVGKDTARQVQPIAVTVKVRGRLTADGDKLVGVMKQVNVRKNN